MIGLVGKKGAGKDTLADYMVNHDGFRKLAFANSLKMICQKLFLLTDEQLNDAILKERIDSRWGYSPRQLLQKVGTDWCRDEIGQDFWIRRMKEEINDGTKDKVVITDVRFENEYEFVKENGGVIILIDGRTNDVTETAQHISEHFVLKVMEKHLYDYRITNDATREDLFHQWDDIYNNLNVHR